MCNSPLVSVVIPAYNAAVTIIPCIESVLNQTYKYLEIIVIDDGSTDTTHVILEEYKAKLCVDNLQIIRQNNAGPSAARNLGIELSQGKYIAFLDSDDLWYAEKIEKQIECFQKSNATLIGCKCRIGNKKRKQISKDLVEITFKKLLCRNYFHTPSVVVRAEVLKNVKFNISQRYSEDYCLWLLIARHYKCIFLNECLVQLSDKPIFGGSGLSAHLWKMEQGELSNYKYLYSLNYISRIKLLFYSSLSLLKYIRRYFLVRFFYV